MATATDTNSGNESPKALGADERRKAAFEYTKSSLLGKRIKTTLSDGRTLTGKFICIDRLKNLILTNVTEERWIDPSDYRYRVGDGNDETKGNEDSSMDGQKIKVERHISQAMIPGSRLVKAELCESIR